MIERATDYMANMLASIISSKMRNVSRSIATGKTSLINSGNNNVISFPVLVSSDIPKDVAADIAKDIECILALATKMFIEGDVNRDPREINMDSIMSSLPFARLNRSDMDSTSGAGMAADIGVGIGAIASISNDSTVFAEAIRMAKEKLEAYKGNIYAESQVAEFLREKGTGATFLVVEIPYVTGKDEIKTVKVHMGFEGVVRFIDNEEFIQRIGNFDSNRFFKSFIKLSKGEISFMGDFLFEMDRLKVEARTQATANKLFKTLEYMNRKRDIFVKSFPFTTFVISDAIADSIKSRFMIDTSDERQVKALMDTFFAFAYYEVNTNTNVIKTIRDGDAMFRYSTVDDIVRNTTKVERKLKELIKIGG